MLHETAFRDGQHIGAPAASLLSRSMEGRSPPPKLGQETNMKPEFTFAVAPTAGQSDSPLFLIGQDSRGNWVVQDQRGLRGGLFVSQAAARKFALFENGDRPELVIMLPGLLELDLSGDGIILPPPRQPEPRPATYGARL
jgi:hypothetical protein